jgi:hypothetical protein
MKRVRSRLTGRFLTESHISIGILEDYAGGIPGEVFGMKEGAKKGDKVNMMVTGKRELCYEEG